MQTIQRSLVRAQFAAMDLIDNAGRRRERGDVPGWVLITLMTAGLVAVLWTAADRTAPDSVLKSDQQGLGALT